jgi:hypothetical protein
MITRTNFDVERRQTVNNFFVPRQLENELLRNNLFENGVSTLLLENQKQHKIIKTNVAQMMKFWIWRTMMITRTNFDVQRH